LESVKRKYFTPDFESAYKKLCDIKEVHKRAIVASQVNSVMKMELSLKPDENKYESFIAELKEWTKERN
jgi:hypothetical protein